MSHANTTLTGFVAECGQLTPVGQTQYLGFRLATNRRAKVGAEWQDVPTWWSIRLWGDRAAGLAQRLAKGDYVFVSGEPFTEEWTGRDGHKRQTLRLDAKQVEIERKGTPKAAAPGAPGAPATTSATPTPGTEVLEEPPW